MHKEKSYFKTQNGSLAICHIGVITIEQYEPVQQLVQHGRYTVNLHRGRATKCYSFFCGQRVWNILKSTEAWRFSMETVVWVRGECMNGWKDFKMEDKMSVMNNEVGDLLAWQLRQWNSRSSSKSVTTGESLLWNCCRIGHESRLCVQYCPWWPQVYESV